MMKTGMRGLSLAIAAFALGGCGMAVAQEASGTIAVSTLGKATLQGSKFRHAGAFDRALRSALETCGKTTSTLPEGGTLSLATATAIKDLQTCPGYDKVSNLAGDITPAVWTKLLPDIPMPDAFGRLFIVTLTLEGTDYDRFEWNYSAADPTAWGTWGPFGATVGQQAEVQKILTAVDKGQPGLVKKAFDDAAVAAQTGTHQPIPSSPSRKKTCSSPTSGPAGDYDLFLAVARLRDQAAGSALRVAYCDDRRFAIWIDAFRRLGASGIVRRAYDRYYFDEPGKVGRYIRNTREAYREAKADATQVDLAMGVDGQTQLSLRADVSKVGAAAASAGAAASPAMRRFAISEGITASMRNRKDRCARDAAFFIGDLPPSAKPAVCKGKDWSLSDAWRERTGFTYRSVGLVDTADCDLKPAWNYDFDH